jgi:hypothetical protein
MVFAAWAGAGAAAPAERGFISLDITLSGKALPQEKVKLLVEQGASSTLTLAPTGAGPRYRFTVVAQSGLPANAPPGAAQVPDPISVSVKVDSAAASEPWVQITSNRLILAGGSTASMALGEPAERTLELVVSARAVSDAEAAAVRAGAADQPRTNAVTRGSAPN